MDGAWETCKRRCCQPAQVLRRETVNGKLHGDWSWTWNGAAQHSYGQMTMQRFHAFVTCHAFHYTSGPTGRCDCSRKSMNYTSGKVNIGTIRRWQASFILRPLYPRCPLSTRLSGPRGQSFIPAGIRTPDRPAPCLITIPILSLIPVNINNHENQTTAAAAVVMDNVLPQWHKPHAKQYRSSDWCLNLTRVPKKYLAECNLFLCLAAATPSTGRGCQKLRHQLAKWQQIVFSLSLSLSYAFWTQLSGK